MNEKNKSTEIEKKLAAELFKIMPAGNALTEQIYSQELREENAMTEAKRLISILDQNFPTPIELAKMFHEAYERYAFLKGWETNPKTRKPFDELPATNKQTMIATCTEILQKLKQDK